MIENMKSAEERCPKRVIRKSELRSAVSTAIKMFSDAVVAERKRVDRTPVSSPQDLYARFIAKRHNLDVDQILNEHLQDKVEKEVQKKNKKKKKPNPFEGMLGGALPVTDLELMDPFMPFMSDCNTEWTHYAFNSFGYDFLLLLSVSDEQAKMDLLQKECDLKTWKKFHGIVGTGNALEPTKKANPLRVSAQGIRFADANIATFQSGLQLLCGKFFPHASLVDQARIFDAVQRFPGVQKRLDPCDAAIACALDLNSITLE